MHSSALKQFNSNPDLLNIEWKRMKEDQRFDKMRRLFALS